MNGIAAHKGRYRCWVWWKGKTHERSAKTFEEAQRKLELLKAELGWTPPRRPAGPNKTCPSCGRSGIPFNRNRATADGLQGICRDCQSKVNTRYRATEGAHEVSRALYARTRETVLVRQRERRSRLPDRYAARMAVQVAINSGTIIRPSVCSACGRPNGTIEAHHESYAPERWLDVVWLCKRCHTQRHTPKGVAA